MSLTAALNAFLLYFLLLGVVPTVMTSRFVPSGAAFEVNFDMETLQAKRQTGNSCEELFDGDTVLALGSSAACYWPSGERLRVDISFDSTFAPNDAVKLRSKSIQAAKVRFATHTYMPTTLSIYLYLSIYLHNK